jgi:hypothetical protein
MKSIPPRGSLEYEPFFEEEKKKIEYGVTIDGVYMHGWLYWHLNHWNIYLDVKDELSPFGITKLKFTRPNCRDNEWIISEKLTQAEQQRKGLMVFGSRRLGKSEFLSSYIGRSATIFQGSENLITGGNWPDIDIITGKLDKGLTSMHPYFRWTRYGDNWHKDIVLGFKEKGGSRVEWSIVKMRNYDGGINTEAAAGTTPSTFVIDEVGKFDWLQCFRAAVPSFMTPFGWRLVPIATGTSGQLKINTDAEKVFNNPESENFLSMWLTEEKKKTAIFIPGTRRMDAKYETDLGNYLETESGILVHKDSELRTIKFWNSDLKKGNQLIEEEIAQASKSDDPTAALKVRMYLPRNTEDLFLSEKTNKFPIEAIKEWMAYLDAHNNDPTIVGLPVRLFRDVTGQVQWESDYEKKEVKDYPVKSSTMKDAPIIIYEMPMTVKPAYLLYIAGADPYNQDDSATSPSLGTVHIYKRTYDLVNGTFQKSIVASYASRPKTMKEWHQNVELLLEFYNATCMNENEGGTFVQYFDSINKSHYLADGYSLNKEISPNTSIKGRIKGLPATPSVINHCMRLLYDYCMEEIVTGVNPTTKELVKKLGVCRIRDRMLLTEMLNYGDENADRIVSFRHALAYDESLNKFHKTIKIEPEEDPKPQPKMPRSPFPLMGSNPFLIPKKARR